MTSKSKVAIIGLGNIGQVVAANLAKSNRPFLAADRNVAKATELASTWGQAAHPSDIASAVKESEIVILSIPFNTIIPFMKQYAGDLEGKIIIDPSNPITPDEKGGFKKIIADDQSAGQINAGSLPAKAKLVKAFGTLGAGSLSSAAYQKSEPAVLFYAADDNSSDAKVEELIADAGFAAVRVGDLSQSARIEVFGDLHEFGALGKTVNAEEAKSKL